MASHLKLLLKDLDTQRFDNCEECPATSHWLSDIGMVIVKEAIRIDFKYLRDIIILRHSGPLIKFYFFDGCNSWCKVAEVLENEIKLYAHSTAMGFNPGRLLTTVSTTEAGLQILATRVLASSPD